MLLHGAFRDRLERPSREPLETPWQSNLVVYRGLDLIGALLCNHPGLAGIAYLAVGRGDPAWDAEAPPADRGRTSLTDEMFRVRLRPGKTLTYDRESGQVHVRVTIGRGKATGTLRELGLYGGDASARPGTGFLVNHKAHAAIEKGANDTLERELFLRLDPSLAPGARDLVGSLLAGRRGLAGITHVALGTSGGHAGEPLRDLVAEAYRRPLEPRRLSYDEASHTILASARFEVGEGPSEVREAGLVGGEATERPGTGFLVVRETSAPIDRRVPARLERRFRLVLVARTNVAVPDLGDQTLDAARAALVAAELILGRIAERESDADAPQAIIDQDPPAGAVVNEGTPVAVVVAVPPLVTVPEIVGEPERAVKTLLRRLGLEVPSEGRVEVASDRPAGTVLTSSPAPGARVPKGTSVALNVAVPLRVAVPDVRGRTPPVATLLLEAAALAVAPEPYPTEESGASPGTVMAQTPAQGEEVEVGTEVKLILAAPWTIEVPNLSGKTPEEAGHALADAAAPLEVKLDLASGAPGLALGAITERAANAPLGTIVAQLPVAGARASLYSTVDVVVVAATTRGVPKLVGLDESGAITALTEGGFVLGTVTRRAADAPAGTVLRQEPPPDVPWPPGARVAITLAAPRQALVPDVVGLTLEAAREAVQARGLVLPAPSTKVDPGPPGTVLSQEPPPRQTVRAGSPIRVVVRAGVPNLVGMSEADARAVLTAIGLPLERVRSREAEGQPGVVLEQNPAAGSRVDPSTRVTIVVSVQRRVELPNVIGTLVDDAARRLEALGLKLAVVGKQESDAPEGSILAQSPATGERVARGTSVAVTIAIARPRTTIVPSVLGMREEQAKAELDAAGLVLEIAAVRPTPGAEPGTVVEQTPAEGEEVRLGAAVSVLLASADPTTEVPDVRRLSVGAATDVLRSTSLALQVAGSRPSAERKGTVLTQEPLPGSRVPAGSVVSVVVSRGGLAVVPHVIGLDEATAVNVLQQAGLQPEVSGQFDLSHPPSTVIAQDPAAGAPAESGSVVRIVVARRFVRPFVREELTTVESPLPPIERPLQPIIERPLQPIERSFPTIRQPP